MPKPYRLRIHVAIDAAHAGARERGEDVAVRQDDEAGLERRDDLLLEPIGEVGRVEQDEGQLVERVARLRQVDGRRHQLRSRPAGLDHAVALHFEPLAQQRDLGRAADAVGAFDRDQLARVVADRQVRDAVAVVLAGLAAAVGAGLLRRIRRRARHDVRFPDAARPAAGTRAADR